MNLKETLLASQPIYTSAKLVYSCELFFQAADTEAVSRAITGEKETSELLVNLITGLTDVRESKVTPIFVSINNNFVLDEPWELMNPRKIVLVVSAISSVTDKWADGLKNWRESGYQFALSNYNFCPHWYPLIEEFKYLSINMEQMTTYEVIEKFSKYKKPGSKAKWIAGQVASEAVFDTCAELGFDLFQGCFLASPKLVNSRVILPNQAQTIELLRAISRPDVSMKELASIVATDPKLTFQLLKIINSPLYQLPRTISSLQEAIVLLGLDALKRWAFLVSMVATSQCEPESCRLILVRARACELECEKSDSARAASAFLTGILSGADVMLNISRSELFNQISVTDDIKKAILMEEGLLGSILQSVSEFEHSVLHTRDPLKEKDNDIASSYGEATIWVNELLNTLSVKK